MDRLISERLQGSEPVRSEEAKKESRYIASSSCGVISYSSHVFVIASYPMPLYHIIKLIS
jgi:hypothetical protein